jgi:hypothetical protein
MVVNRVQNGLIKSRISRLNCQNIFFVKFEFFIPENAAEKTGNKHELSFDSLF